MIKIAVVDDDPDIHKIFNIHFENELNADLVSISSYLEALASFINHSFDLYIIDLNLDGYSGLDIIRLLQKESRIENRIVLMSERLDKESTIEAYKLGVSNVVNKPLDFEIMRAILKKNLEMVQNRKDSFFVFGQYEFDSDRHTCTHSKTNKLVKLTPIEFLILERLLIAKGRTITKEQLCDIKTGASLPMSFKSLEMKIVGLRKKLVDSKDLIQTVRGVGYKVFPH